MSNLQTVLCIQCMQKTMILDLDLGSILILIILLMIVKVQTTNGITFYAMRIQVSIMIMAV